MRGREHGMASAGCNRRRPPAGCSRTDAHTAAVAATLGRDDLRLPGLCVGPGAARLMLSGGHRAARRRRRLETLALVIRLAGSVALALHGVRGTACQRGADHDLAASALRRLRLPAQAATGGRERRGRLADLVVDLLVADRLRRGTAGRAAPCLAGANGGDP